MKRVLVALFLGGCSFLGGLTAVALGRAGPAAWAQMTGQPSADPDRLEEKFEAVAGKIGPCVVSVEAVKTTVRDGKPKTIEESGSGVLFRFPLYPPSEGGGGGARLCSHE